MKLIDIKNFCHIFCFKFSALNLGNFQLQIFDSVEAVSVALVKFNMCPDIAAAINITEDEVRLLKIESFDPLDCVFTYNSPLELFGNLFSLLVLCCHALKKNIDPVEALSVMVCKKIKRWQDLIIFLCSLSPDYNSKIQVLENADNSIMLFKTKFYIANYTLFTEGFYRSRVQFNDTLGLINAVLDALSAILKINNCYIDPLASNEPRTPADIIPHLPSLPIQRFSKRSPAIDWP